ncbi:MAG: hypothetical protein IKF53_03240, partial [Clostridia bacterium]|nr:hypothetical protein [Clostridia bacterium]
MKKISIRVLSTVLSFILMITLFSSVSGLSAFAIDNTPASTEVVEKVSVEKIVEETADNKAAEITEKVEETEEKTFSANSSIRTKSTTADAKGATSGIYTYSVSNGEATVTKCN